MKEIKAFETSDGKIFSNIADAKEHQQNVYFEKRILQIIDKADLPYNGGEIIFDFLMENKAILELAFLPVVG
tara:strand:+ start:1040 stop:1255 length:216 start_codon:yes stop_codon:yes gene_type:complete